MDLKLSLPGGEKPKTKWFCLNNGWFLRLNDLDPFYVAFSAFQLIRTYTGSMHKVDAKLAKWNELYGRLKEARERYKAAPAEARPDLKVEVDLLQRQCGAALDELQAEYAKLKIGDSGADSR